MISKTPLVENSGGLDGAAAGATRTETLLRGGRGDCVLHCGQLLHGGASVTAGTRLLLVGFVSERLEGWEHEARAAEMHLALAHDRA